MKKFASLFILLVAFVTAAIAQSSQPTPPTALGGVAITSDGLLQMRKSAPAAATRRAGDPSLTYVSLAKVLDAVQNSGGKKLPRELRFLQGLTRLEYIFVYPGPDGDIVLAGPSEPFREENPIQPVGTVSGRPVLQLEDFIIALRSIQQARHDTIFGCSLDLAPGADKIAAEVARRYTGTTNADLAQAVKNALGPQIVRVLGVPSDSRVALAMVTADYRLKRAAMGAESLAGIGNAVSSGLAANRVWFEPSYEPLGVSEDGLSYQLAGPRLKVLAGAHDFEAKGATPAAVAFAKRFTDKMPDVSTRITEYADLQNVTDLFLAAALIRQDDLARKSGLDLAWILSPNNYKTASHTVPKTAETVITDTGGMITEGGVIFALRLFPADRGKGNAMLASSRDRPRGEWYLTRRQRP